jgi:uncharacterized membrane protein
MLPPWPGWDGLHPLVVHFPIALLLVAPVFVLMALLSPGRTATFGVPAVVLLALGTIAAFVSVESGEAAAELATRTEAVTQVLERHSSLAETVTWLFAVMTVAYGLAVAGLLRVKRFSRPSYAFVVHGVFLALMLAGAGMVANTAHQGGVLVHGLGVRSMLAQPVNSPANTP